MALANMAEYRSALANPFQNVPINKAALTVNASGLATWSMWTATPFAGAAPTTAAAPTGATAGALKDRGGSNVRADAVNSMFYAGYESSRAGGTAGALILIDRLSHQGGLDGTVTTAGVTTNLPTAALTRYTNGTGVMAAIEIYTQIGTTGTTITCSYTNQGGTNGRTSQPVAIGATGSREVGKFIPLNLADGDSGVRSIESSTLAGTTGTAGAFGYTLFKPLAMIPFLPGQNTEASAILGNAGCMPEIVDDACLQFLWWNGSANGTTGVIQGNMAFIDA